MTDLMIVDSPTVGAALAGILASQLAETGCAAGGQLHDPPAGPLWCRLRSRLDSVPDATGAIASLRSNPRNRAAELVLGDEISHLLDTDPELAGLAVAIVDRSSTPTAAAA